MTTDYEWELDREILAEKVCDDDWDSEEEGECPRCGAELRIIELPDDRPDFLDETFALCDACGFSEF